MFAPLRSSPIALYLRESLHDWLLLSNGPQTAELPANARRVFDALSKSGAQFFTEIVRGSGLLPVQVEQSLAGMFAGFAQATREFRAANVRCQQRDEHLIQRREFAQGGRRVECRELFGEIRSADSLVRECRPGS